MVQPMRWRLTFLALILAPSVRAQGAGDNEYAADEAILREQNLPTKGAELLQILRERTPKAQTTEQFYKLVARLKAAPYPERVRATGDLVKMGPLIRPLLESVLAEGKVDAEAASRLRHVLEKFPAEKDIAAVTAAARLIQRDKPADSLPVLFDFVPHATSEEIRQEVQRAINATALLGKEPAPILTELLKDDNVQRKAAAAEALVRVGSAAGMKKITPLLKDAQPQVRFQVGLALVEQNDKSGLPLLIQSIADMPPDAVETALDLLYRAAGEDAPTVVYEGKKNAAACSAAWSKWQAKFDGKLDLAKQLAKTNLGFTVIASTALGAKANLKSQIFELGAGNVRRWEFDGPRYCLDVQVIGPDRLLVAEYLDNRVTERDFKGTVLKTFPARMASGCQRLPSGQTLIVSRQALQIVDREGKETFSWPAPQPFGIAAAFGMRNGQIAVATSDQKCRLIDKQGRELKSFQLGHVYPMGGSIEVLPNGHVLAPLYSMNVVAEFDWTGNKLWQINVTRPTSATRLANGNTLVGCGMTIPGRVIEFDKSGTEVWSCGVDGRYVRARRR